ncbi:MAG: hypothetical protein ACFFBV_09270 [Promethearchaeota archaeon]
MAKKSIITIAIINIIIVIIIATIPTTILLLGYSNYGRIDESITYEYTPSTPSPIEKLNIYSDIGNVDIKYTDQPVNYILKINVNIKMSGSGLNEKSYLDFFNTAWHNTSSPVNFTMKLISGSWFDSSKFFERNVSISVTIRSDIVLDIITTVYDGNIKLTVPSGVSINNLLINLTNGNVFYNFYSCIIRGNVTGIINLGNFELKTFDARYTQNSYWNFTIETGNFDIYISQYIDLEANITGKVIMNGGILNINYDDNSANIGAKFQIPYGNSRHVTEPNCMYHDLTECLDGFEYNDAMYNNASVGIHCFTSNDVLTNKVNYYYNLIFEIIDSSFYLDLKSIN